MAHMVLARALKSLCTARCYLSVTATVRATRTLPPQREPQISAYFLSRVTSGPRGGWGGGEMIRDKEEALISAWPRLSENCTGTVFR
jgi:hypothetical protein